MKNVSQVATFYYYLSTGGRKTLGARDVSDALRYLDSIGKVVIDIVPIPTEGILDGVFFKVANT